MELETKDNLNVSPANIATLQFVGFLAGVEVYEWLCNFICYMA